jgi:hypothetical protein
MLKTTSGSSPRTDLSNNITFSLSQNHATVPLREERNSKKKKGRACKQIFRKIFKKNKKDVSTLQKAEKFFFRKGGKNIASGPKHTDPWRIEEVF